VTRMRKPKEQSGMPSVGLRRMPVPNEPDRVGKPGHGVRVRLMRKPKEQSGMPSVGLRRIQTNPTASAGRRKRGT
jgi:hypothetical protein